MGKRRKGRILAFQAMYAWDTANNKEQALKDLLNFSWVENKPPVNSGRAAEGGQVTEDAGNDDSIDLVVDFPRLLVAGTIENIKAVDAMIRRHLVNWDFSRLSGVDRALLRLSVHELLSQTAPPTVVIDEAVDIAKEYGTDDSYRFINGVLDGIKKAIQSEKMPSPGSFTGEI